MYNVLERLIDLQDIDVQLQRLEGEKGDLPQKVASLSAEVERTKNVLAQMATQKAQAIAEKAAVDNNVVLMKEKLKKYKVQLYQVKTNKEYDAITIEIETSQQKIDEQDYRSLELDETVKQLEENIVGIRQKLGELDVMLVENKKYLAAKLEKTKEEEDDLLRRRNSLTVNLSRPILATYERIRHGRGGVAVAKLINGACSECSSRFPPQRGQEIRMMNKINLCEVCGRIVIWKPEFSQVEESE